jgi:pimeloyl-ACP methyl ester carboxylesterase
MGGLDLGPPERPVDLIFLHATGFTGGTYRPLVAPFADRLRILLPDARGHGRTSLPADPNRLTSWETLAKDLVGLLDKAVDPSRPVVLAGHSLGAVTALLAAQMRPQHVCALVLVDPVLFRRFGHPLMRLPGIQHLLRRFIPIAANAARRQAHFPDRQSVITRYASRGLFKPWQPGFLEAYLEDGLVEDGQGVRLACDPAWEAATFVAAGHNWRQALRQVTCPVHIIVAGRESTVAVPMRELEPLNPGLTWEIVAQSGHMIPMEQPETVRARLLASLTI